MTLAAVPDGVPAAPSSWVVVGPPGVARDVAHSVVADVATGPVAVLVDPTERHWLEAAERPVVVVSSRPLPPAEAAALVLRGADAVVGSDAPPERLAEAVAVVAGGGTMLDPHVARLVADAARAAGGGVAVPSLSAREGEILACIARGLSVKQTARRLGVAHKTVENIQSRLFRKLGVRNRAQAVARAHALGVTTG